jgi:hypothetical protein
MQSFLDPAILFFVFGILIVIVFASVRIEKVDLGLLGSSMLHPILLRYECP